MQKDNSRTINLRGILYKFLKNWRFALMFGIIIGIIAGISLNFREVTVILDSTKYEAAKDFFESELEAWSEKEDLLISRLKDLNSRRASQLEYNDNSLLMQIDPENECCGTFEFDINVGYYSTAEQAYQSIRDEKRILNIYSDYINNAGAAEYILDNSAIETECKYIREVIKGEANYYKSCIEVTVIGSSASDVSAIVGPLKASLVSKYEDVNSEIAPHRYSFSDVEIKMQQDSDLEGIQKKNADNISLLETSVQNSLTELDSWYKDSAPEFKYQPVAIAMSFIKHFVLVFAGC
ncbi:MAG: hypothetical protein MJ186_01005, partial [Clostridia bacterium]|nr:hypothetical protein [Clostridia bacterium]